MTSTRPVEVSGGTMIDTVVVVDPRPAVAAAFASLLADALPSHRVEVAGEAASAPYEPSVALVPLLGGADRQETIERLAGDGHRVVTVGPESPQVALAAEAGSWGHLREHRGAAELIDAVREVAGGRTLFSREDRDALTRILREGRSAFRSEGLSSLTPREIEVLQELCRGRRPAEIAEDHFVSVRTVRNQVQSILTKLNVHSQLEAVAVATRHPSFTS